MKKILYIFFAILPFSGSFAAEAQAAAFAEANKAYAAENYSKAIGFYEKVLADGYVSAELYYNLGNAYYRGHKIAYAILNYERARKLAPGDEDINFNLKLANQHIADKIEPVPELFIKELQAGFIHSFSESGWSWLSIAFFTFSLLFLAVYRMAGKIAWRQAGFGMAVAFLLFSVSAFLFARKQYQDAVHKDQAIIIAPSTSVNGSPSESGTRLFLLHEGSKVKIQKTEGQWSEIKIANGNSGWVKNNSFIAF